LRKPLPELPGSFFPCSLKQLYRLKANHSRSVSSQLGFLNDRGKTKNNKPREFKSKQISLITKKTHIADVVTPD
jgi:hypothetical protein